MVYASVRALESRLLPVQMQDHTITCVLNTHANALCASKISAVPMKRARTLFGVEFTRDQSTATKQSNR